MQKNFYGRAHITAICFYFNLNLLKKLEFWNWILEAWIANVWTPLQIFFCGITFHNYFVTMGRKSMISSAVKKCWDSIFADFRDLVLVLGYLVLGSTTDSQRWCSIKKKMFLKILQHRKAPVPESLCKLQLYLKRDSPDDSVHWGMSPPKKHHPPLSCQVPPLKSANCRNGRGVGGGGGGFTLWGHREFSCEFWKILRTPF